MGDQSALKSEGENSRSWISDILQSGEWKKRKKSTVIIGGYESVPKIERDVAPHCLIKRSNIQNNKAHLILKLFVTSYLRQWHTKQLIKPSASFIMTTLAGRTSDKTLSFPLPCSHTALLIILKLKLYIFFTAFNSTVVYTGFLNWFTKPNLHYFIHILPHWGQKSTQIVFIMHCEQDGA